MRKLKANYVCFKGVKRMKNDIRQDLAHQSCYSMGDTSV